MISKRNESRFIIFNFNAFLRSQRHKSNSVFLSENRQLHCTQTKQRKEIDKINKKKISDALTCTNAPGYNRE